MAIEIGSMGLKYVPGTSTGLYQLPDEQAGRIVHYLAALYLAKDAGVLGNDIRYPQAYVDKVTSQRVADARAGGQGWADRCAEMDRDEAAWAVRTADHATRAVGRNLTMADITRDEAALAIAARARTLDAATLERLDERRSAVVVRDEARAQELTRERVDPQMASLRGRAFRHLSSRSEAYERARRLFADLPAAAADAAIAVSVWDDLGGPERSLLYGPWAEVVEGDPLILEGAWSGAADRLRAQWLDLPSEAFGWSADRDLDQF
jgi:hypothetical protein